MNPHIRIERASDHAPIAALITEAFAQAAHRSGTEALIVDALRRAGALTLSLVAECGGELAGHVALSPVSVSDGAEAWFGLGPIAVRPSLQGQGIGAALMHEALARLRAQGAAGCVLLGDPAYYARFGFQPLPGLVLPGVPPEYFMALPFCLAAPQGSVAYHAAFDTTA